MKANNGTGRAAPGPNPFRALPKIDELLAAAGSDAALRAVPRPVLLFAARTILKSEREAIRDGKKAAPPAVDYLAALREATEAFSQSSLAPVVNATGVVLHTGLGRAPLGDRVVAAIAGAARYCALEIEAESGARGRRDQTIRQLLCPLLGVEDATAVNNNAAATMLAVNTFANGRELIISRGELVEIGGSYRMPAVVSRGGARLVEVGTTNRTRIFDYEHALTESTGAIMKVHTSNYRIGGFTEDASLGEIVELGRRRGIPVIHDLGSGLLTKDLAPALEREPVVADSVAAGPDLILFSGDKLLGGPQAGIIAGRRDAVAAVRENPMFRAMRLDKLILAGIEETLKIHLEGAAARDLPALYKLNVTKSRLEEVATELARRLKHEFPALTVDCRETVSEAGSGSAPTTELATVSVVIARSGISAAELARRLRCGRPAVYARVHDDLVWLDPRTLAPPDLDLVVRSLRAVL